MIRKLGRGYIAFPLAASSMSATILFAFLAVISIISYKSSRPENGIIALIVGIILILYVVSGYIYFDSEKISIRRLSFVEKNFCIRDAKFEIQYDRDKRISKIKILCNNISHSIESSIYGQSDLKALSEHITG